MYRYRTLRQSCSYELGNGWRKRHSRGLVSTVLLLCHPELFGFYSPSPLFLCRAHADRFLATTFFLGRRGNTEESDDFGADGRAEAGASVPTRAGGKCAVVSRDDVVERRRSLRGIDLGLDKSSALSVLLIVECDEPRPKRGDGAGAADDHALAIDTNLVAGHRV